MSLLEIIKKLRLIDIKFYFKDFFKLTNIKIDKVIINSTLDDLTPERFEEIKKKSLETTEEISKKIEEVSGLPNQLKEAVAKSIVAETILINLSTLKQKISKGLVKLDPNINVSLLIRCDNCGKFFDSGIGGNFRALVSLIFISNIHQCQNCGNNQLARDNSDYFVFLRRLT